MKDKKIVFLLIYVLVGGMIFFIIGSRILVQSNKIVPPISISPPPPSSAPYDCPDITYIDCMPGIVDRDTVVNPYRSLCGNQDFYTWAKKNCPGFEGFAY
jgi:hypothetical protein